MRATTETQDIKKKKLRCGRQRENGAAAPRLEAADVMRRWLRWSSIGCAVDPQSAGGETEPLQIQQLQQDRAEGNSC